MTIDHSKIPKVKGLDGRYYPNILRMQDEREKEEDRKAEERKIRYKLTYLRK
jgi:hypothetical protein